MPYEFHQQVGPWQCHLRERGLCHIATGCLLFFLLTEDRGGSTYLGLIWVGTTLGALVLGLAALVNPRVRSGERRGQTQAWVGLLLGLLQVPLYGLMVIYGLLYLLD